MTSPTSYFDDEIKAAVGVFDGFLTAEEFKKIAENLHQLRIDNNSNKQLNNIEDMRVLTKEIRDWLKATWFPKAIETGLEYFAFVVPRDLIGKYSMKNANREAESIPDMEIKYFQSEPEARAWLQSKSD